MEVVAKGRYIRSSAQKMRLITNLVKGKEVFKALELLTFLNKKSAFLVKKVLKSAISNAEHNYQLNINKLKIIKIFVDNGPSIKRIMPRAKGRSDNIIKRTSHLTIIISE